MGESDLIDAHVSAKQCKRAVETLHAYVLKKEEQLQEKELLPGTEQYVWLQISVKRMHPEKKLKPIRIPLKHGLVDPRTSGVCLITKDPQREYKDLLASHDIKFISRVVGIAKLKGKFKPFEARRLLLKENGMFLADSRVIPLLPGLLGRKWFEAKKQPIPVDLTRKDLKKELERAIDSTYMHQNRGTCMSVKVGKLSQTPVQVLSNIKVALPVIAKNVKGGWGNIQSLQIKTNSSVSLPIWTCDLGDDEGGRWDGFTFEKEENPRESSQDEAEETREEIVVEELSTEKEGKSLMKGTKRRVVEDADKPKKKAKATTETTVVSSTSQESTIPEKPSTSGLTVKSRKKQKKHADAQ